MLPNTTADREIVFGSRPAARSAVLVEMLSTGAATGAAVRSSRTTGIAMTTGIPARREQALDPVDAPAARGRCSLLSEQPGFVFSIQRMMGLDTAATLLGGKPKLAEALSCSLRNVHHKIGAGRGVSNLDLILAATALEQRAATLIGHAEKLRAEAAACLT